MKPVPRFVQLQVATTIGAFFADVCNVVTDDYESEESAAVNREWLRKQIPKTDDRLEWRRFLLAVAKRAVETLEGGHR